MSWHKLGWKSENRTKSVMYGIAGFILVYINIIMWAVVTNNMGEQPQWVDFSLARFALFAFFGFGLAPWTEENLFRGYLQPLLIKRYGVILGILIQACLFSIAHIGFYHNVTNFGSAFTFGIILELIRRKDDSVIPAFIAHGLFWMIPVFLDVSLS